MFNRSSLQLVISYSVPLSITVLSANFLNSIRIVIVSVNGLLANDFISASVIPYCISPDLSNSLFFALTLLCSLAPLGFQFYCMRHTYILYEKSDGKINTTALFSQILLFV